MPNSKIALAQLVEHGPFKPVVAGSSPACGKELVVSLKTTFLIYLNRMNYLWIAIAILLIVLVSTKTIKRETFAGRCSRSCPVHGTRFDPPYPHAFHYVFLDEGRNRVYECTKCRCQTNDPDDYPTNLSY